MTHKLSVIDSPTRTRNGSQLDLLRSLDRGPVPVPMRSLSLTWAHGRNPRLLRLAKPHG
jgi:hypothetical protein